MGQCRACYHWMKTENGWGFCCEGDEHTRANEECIMFYSRLTGRKENKKMNQ